MSHVWSAKHAGKRGQILAIHVQILKIFPRHGIADQKTLHLAPAYDRFIKTSAENT